VVCGAFEAVYWTQDVATAEEEVRGSFPVVAMAGRELWLTGTASDRARFALQEREWQVHAPGA
jgi:hypothetical protein